MTQTDFEDLQSYVYELQTTAKKYFKPEKIRDYLTILKESDGGVGACHLIAHYMLVVQGMNVYPHFWVLEETAGYVLLQNLEKTSILLESHKRVVNPMFYPD